MNRTIRDITSTVLIFNSPVFREGRRLAAEAVTEKEKAAARAYKRILTGTIILVTLMCVALISCTVLLFLNLEDGIRRYGTVQEDGVTVQYVQGTIQTAALETLGLESYEMASGDRVVLFFDSVEDTLLAAYPKEIYDQKMEIPVCILGFSMLFFITLLLFYALYICRYTDYGRDWYLYLRSLYGSEQKPEYTRRQKVILYAVTILFAALLLWPQLMNLCENAKNLYKVHTFGQLLSDGKVNAAQASEMQSALDEMQSEIESENGAVQDALQEADDASEKIQDILDQMGES
ncbi:MAG: hypothetical protein IJ496_09925 [Ruminococcus sp.]|nr:hypothetical protein [Ruminococcus sp.]